MKLVSIALLVALCAVGYPQHGARNASRARIASLSDLAKYVGTYPCSNGLLDQRVLLNSLRAILATDYRAYREFMAVSGCGAIERQREFLLMDVSQQHVGGYTSYILVRPEDGTVFLFWLKSTVGDKQWEFYGPKPIPTSALDLVQTKLNVGWGHVAHFAFVGQKLTIRLNSEH